MYRGWDHFQTIRNIHPYPHELHSPRESTHHHKHTCLQPTPLTRSKRTMGLQFKSNLRNKTTSSSSPSHFSLRLFRVQTKRRGTNRWNDHRYRRLLTAFRFMSAPLVSLYCDEGKEGVADGKKPS